jgi:hypothetical protein
MPSETTPRREAREPTPRLDVDEWNTTVDLDCLWDSVFLEQRLERASDIDVLARTLIAKTKRLKASRTVNGSQRSPSFGRHHP